MVQHVNMDDWGRKICDVIQMIEEKMCQGRLRCNHCELKRCLSRMSEKSNSTGSYDTETTSGRICRTTWSDRVSSTISMSYRL